MRTVLVAALVASLSLAAGKAGKGGGGKKGGGCPFVGVADIDKEGSVQNVQGLEPKEGGAVQAFDVDGSVGKLHVTSSGDIKFAGGVPAKVKNAAFTHALLVDGSIKGLHVAEPEKDLPEGIFAEAVQIYLADGKGGRVALVSIPGENDADGCTEIDCKVGSAWKKCWSDCK
ncbi:MAG: hypothetical protein JST54_10550 [Deltaproteobacteria bacterium]|nr:hypothetical protein [Deltaproteobacteria bacterium]